MKFKFCIFLMLLLFSGNSTISSQITNKDIYDVNILKVTNHNGKIVFTNIKIDSFGNIYKQNQKTAELFEIKPFTKEIIDFITKEKVDKYSANNDPPPEVSLPETNKHAVIISVTFKEDVYNEKKFANKTCYSWGQTFNKDENEYLFFKYLTKKESVILRKMLE